MAASGGCVEQARAARLLARVQAVPDDPSDRALAIRPTRNIEAADIIILGTADRLGIVTMTSDRRAVRAAQVQGVDFQVFLHLPAPLTGV